MHKRIIPLLTAGALAISSLIVSTVSAQADPADSATPAVQADNASTPAAPDDTSTPAAQAPSDTPIAAADDAIATINGTVSPADAPNLSVQICELDNSQGITNLTNCQGTDVDDTGAYSATVTPGSTVVVRASADGYLYTWLGGHTDSQSYLNSYSDASVTAPETGTMTVDDIVLQQAGSISGHVILPSRYSFSGANSSYSGYAVNVYEVASDGTVSSSPAVDTYNLMVANDGAYTIGGLKPGVQYKITVDPSHLQINPSNDFIKTDHDGFVTATVAGTQGADIPLTMGAVISGTVTVPGATDALNVTVYICEATEFYDGSWISNNNCTSKYLGGTSLQVSSNTYSLPAPVTPGGTVVVYATATGYLATYVGGYADSYSVSDVSADAITKITTDPNGGKVENQNIELKKAGSISGSVILPNGYTFTEGNVGSPNYVTAFPIDTTSGTPRMMGGTRPQGLFGGYFGSVSGSSAAYSINNVVPGRQYLVVVEPGNLRIDQTNDLVTTSAGGYASTSYESTWDYTRADMGLVTATVDGTPNVNITMVKGAVVSGTITPKDAVNKAVQVCELTGTGTRQSVSRCNPATVDTTTGYYSSAGITPGAAVVVRAKADGYLYTWLGTYTDTYDAQYSVYDGMTQVPAPATEQNIELQKAAVISGTLSLPAGYTLSRGYVTAAEVVQNEDGPSLVNTYSSTISGSTSSDGAYRLEVKPGSTYVVYAPASSQSLSQGNNSDLLLAIAGGYQTESSYLYVGTDLSDPSIDKITMTEDKTVNLTMAAGSKITGTVYLPDGTPLDFSNQYGGVTCVPVSGYTNGSWTSSAYATESSDGSYSCTVIPGRDYIVQADTDHNPTTWVGDFVGSRPTLPNAKVTKITAPVLGQTTSGQDIHLIEGSSVSGKLIGYVPNPDPQMLMEVYACVLYPDGSRGDCGYTNTVDDNGNYTVTGLVPEANTVVSVAGNGYTRTWYGGYLGSSPSLPNAKVTEFTSAALGGNVPNIDVTLVKPVTITGSIIPSSVVTDSWLYSPVWIYGCPVYTQDGQKYYKTADGIRGMGGIYSGDDHSAFDDERYCAWNSANSDGTYSVQVLPGVDYVIIAQADGYADAWHGGYIGDSGVVDADTAPDLPLPSSTQIQVLSGTAGQTLTGKDIVFGASVTVTFDADGGTLTTATKSTAPGGTIVLPAPPTRTGYTFVGWYTAKNGAGTQFLATTAVPADITVYAKWTQTVTHTVTFMDGVSTTPLATVTVNDGAAATAPADPTRTGFTFAGWDKAFDNVTSDLTVTAKWTENEQAATYTLKYDANGGSGSMDSATYSAGETATVAANGFAKIGYTFVSWNTSADGKGTTYAPAASLTVNGDTTLYAQWALGAVTVYNVTFADGQGHTITTVPVASGGAATAPADPTRTGYTFAGWDKAFDKVTSDLTVTATWTQLATYTVSFDGNGGTGSMDSLTGYDGDSVTIPANAFTLKDHILTGWNTQADGKGKPYPAGSSVTLTGNVTLYAQWKVPEQYTVTFVDGQGKTWTMTVDEMSSATPPPDPVRDGYTFAGWDTAFDKVTGNLTITAVWTPNTPEPNPPFPTGGTAQHDGYLLVLAGTCVAAGLVIRRFSLSTKRG